MKFCLSYVRGSGLLDTADEISIWYQPGRATELIDFIQKHQNQRIILKIGYQDNSNSSWFSTNKEYELINAIKEKYTGANIAVEFFTKDSEFNLKNLIVPYFFSTPISTFDQLHYYIDKGVSDVILESDICFSLKCAKTICSNHGVKIRIDPRRASSSAPSYDPLTHFFIRPEDLSALDNYIDVIFFDTINQDIYYNIYFKDKEWFGDLQDLIEGLNFSVDNRCIIPSFGTIRATCSKKCKSTGKCNICPQIYSISKKLANNDLIIRRKKDH